MSIDIIHLNDIPFLIIISEHIYYRIARAIDNLIYGKLNGELKKVIYSYIVYSFWVILILVDIQFKALKDRNEVRVPFNTVSKGEHILKIEQLHEVFKEQ